MKKTCIQCGEEYEAKNKKSLFCSHPCYSVHKLKPNDKICLTCGKSFKSKYWQKIAKFCSMKCSSFAQAKPLPTCEHCGKVCNKHGRRFCSRDCKVAAYRGGAVYNYVGENFRKDAYPVDYSAWMSIAREIRERDIVCRHCGKSPEANGRALDIHHIIPYRVSQNNTPSNLVALCRSCHKLADHAYGGLVPAANS